MAMTLRLPEALSAEAVAYAAPLGLSLTNLVAVALREYLDARPAPRATAGASLPAPGVASQDVAQRAASARSGPGEAAEAGKGLAAHVEGGQAGAPGRKLAPAKRMQLEA